VSNGAPQQDESPPNGAADTLDADPRDGHGRMRVARVRRVGVIGGMGPAATVLFMSRVIDAVAARDDADHIPLLVDQNPQVPSRIRALLEGGDEDPAPVIAAMAQRLAQAGAEALVMPCNTAHHYAPDIRSAVDIPFISMVDLAVGHAAALAPGGAMGMLGSPALAKTGVFEPSAVAAGISLAPLVNPNATLASIQTIKSAGLTEETRRQVTEEAHALAEAGASSICVCCTEFSLVARDLRAPVPVFDALDLLVNATIRFAREEDPRSALVAQAAHNLNREKETT